MAELATLMDKRLSTTNQAPKLKQLFDSRLAELSAGGSDVNAPPSGISATPQMTPQSLYGRKDDQGRDIFLDTTSGIPVGSYWSIAKHSDPEAQLDYLAKHYPESKPRIIDTGDVVIQVPDSATGKVKDVVLNPSGIGVHDLVDLAVSTPELAAGMATAIATRGRGVLKSVAQLVLSAGATAAAGAARDVYQRTVDDIPVRPGDIARNRGGMAVVDVALGGGLGLFGKASRMLSPFAKEPNKGSLAFNFREAQDFFKKNYGIDIPSTPGTRTGNQTLLAVESAEGKMPGSRGVLTKIAEQRDTAFREIQRFALGDVTPDEQIGASAIHQIRSRITEPLETAFTQARESAIAKSDQRALDLIDEVIGAAPDRVTLKQAGVSTKEAFDRKLIQAQTKVDAAYAKVNELPGGKGDVLDGTAAADMAAEIREELPAVLKQVEESTVMVDEFGRPMTRSAERRVELPSGKPEGLEKALSDLEALRGGKVSLQTLTNLKKSAFDAIAAFKTAHGDVKDRWFTKIAGAYEKGIQRGIEETGDPALKSALQNARDIYKKEMVPLERVGVRELAKTEFDPGNIAPEQIVKRLFEGDRAVTNYEMLKSTLGANNSALRGLKRAWVDMKISEATDKATGVVQTDKLERAFSSLKDSHPELASEMFGKNYKPIMETLRLGSAIKEAGIKSIDEGELRVLMGLKDPTVSDLKNVLRIAKTRDEAYVNKFFKDVSDNAPLENFKPAKFVESLRNTDVDSAQIKDVMSALDTGTREAIATSEFYRLLNAASVGEGETAAKAIAGEQVNLSPTKLVKAIGTGKDRDRTMLLLGEELAAPGSRPPLFGEKGVTRFEVLDAIVRGTAPKEASKTAFSSLGGIGAGMALRDLTDHPLKYASRWAKNAAISTAYVRGLGRLLTNTRFDPETSAALANAMIASEPFVRGTVEAFGPDAAREVVNDLKSSIDRYIMEFQDSPEGRRRVATRQFLQGQSVPMRMETQR